MWDIHGRGEERREEGGRGELAVGGPGQERDAQGLNSGNM